MIYTIRYGKYVVTTDGITAKLGALELPIDEMVQHVDRHSDTDTDAYMAAVQLECIRLSFAT